MHYLFRCPSERPISLETLHGSQPLCGNNGLCPSGRNGGSKWMTFPYPLVMIPLSRNGGEELLSFKLKGQIWEYAAMSLYRFSAAICDRMS